MRRFGIILLATLSFISCGNKKTEIYTRSASEAALAEKFTLDILKEILLITPNFITNQEYTKDSNIVVLSDPEITTEIYPKTIKII